MDIVEEAKRNCLSERIIKELKVLHAIYADTPHGCKRCQRVYKPNGKAQMGSKTLSKSCFHHPISPAKPIFRIQDEKHFCFG
ncbi:unnamed protein product [Clavelina lepadiformis]|uniref:Uncharacterized protein n=1 Tax=Clavelina lepadiformis TaxID=159417 RepID=A0ABP0FSI5_CLALP